MGTTYYVERKINFFGVYECSRCKSMELLQFQMVGNGASTMSQKKAAEVIEESCEDIVNALQNFRTKPFLLSKCYSGRKWTNAYEVKLVNGGHHCPFCDNHEIWQRGEYYVDACVKDPETNVPLVSDCPESSRMLVFADQNTAVEAMRKLLAFRNEQYRAHWEENPEEAQRIKTQLEFLNNSIAQLQPRKDAARAKSNHLNELIGEKEAQMKKLPLFSSEKKVLKAELKELQAKYSAQKDADILEERRLKTEIGGFEQQIKELKIANPGILDELEQFRGDDEFVHLAVHLS